MFYKLYRLIGVKTLYVKVHKYFFYERRKIMSNGKNKKTAPPKTAQKTPSEVDIVRRMTKIAYSDITDFIEFGVDENGENFISLKDSEKVDGSLISEIKINNGNVSLKLMDRSKALEWLGNNIKNKNESDDKELIIAVKNMNKRIKK